MKHREIGEVFENKRAERMVENKRGFGRAIAEAVSGRLLTAEARVRFQGTPYGVRMWWTNWHWGRVFSEYFCFPLPVIIPQIIRSVLYPLETEFLLNNIYNFSLYLTGNAPRLH
jgi:hypothetical protein